MAPPGIRTKEWYELNSKGQEIFCKSWLTKEGNKVKGVVCFCHGYGDTCTFFFEGIAKRIAGAGYAVFAVDHPGFGLSDGLHGYISRFDDIVDNVIEQHAKIKGSPELQGLPRFLFGQSMGGAVALKTHLKEPDQGDGMILVAPMCKGSSLDMSDELLPSERVLKFADLLSNVIPQMKFFPSEDLAMLAFRNLKYRKMAHYNFICYSVLGSSRQLGVGPVSIASLVVGAMLSGFVSPTEDPDLYLKLAVTSTLFAGLFQASLGLFSNADWVHGWSCNSCLSSTVKGIAWDNSFRQQNGDYPSHVFCL